MVKNKKSVYTGIILFVAFLVYTVLLKVVDVQPIGPEGSFVGFATINLSVIRVFSYNPVWYELSEWLGYLAIGVCLGFGLLGLWQLIRGKSLKAVDRELWVLAGFYVVVMAFYAAFEVIVINYRPIILDEGLEASYPSSHTVLAACVFISAAYEFEKYLSKNKVLMYICEAIVIVAAVFTIVGRFFSGVHWVTDIVGGLILSASLISCFMGIRE